MGNLNQRLSQNNVECKAEINLSLIVIKLSHFNYIRISKDQIRRHHVICHGKTFLIMKFNKQCLFLYIPVCYLKSLVRKEMNESCKTVDNELNLFWQYTLKKCTILRLLLLLLSIQWFV